MRNRIMKLNDRLTTAAIKLHNEKGYIEMSSGYYDAVFIIMRCLIDGINPSNDELEYVKYYVKYYEDKASGMGSEVEA